MLTEKCPHCGSYNDPSAAVCYFCQKEIPATGKQKKKRAAPPKSGDVVFASSSTPQRISRPGCLMIYIFLLFLFALAVTLLLINAAGGYYSFHLPPAYEQYTSFLTDAVAGPENADLNTLLTLVLPIVGIVLALSLGMGLFLLKKWARMMAILVQVLLGIGFGGYFYILLTRYYNQYAITTDFVIVFIGTMILILINLYGAVWFFERSRKFGVRPPHE